MSKPQIHRRLHREQVTLFLDAYLAGYLTRQETCDRLGCGKSRFHTLLKAYRRDSDTFNCGYKRAAPNYRICASVEEMIADHLREEQKLIRNYRIPIQYYNYRAVRDAVVEKTGIQISAQTVRNRAKKWKFINPKIRKKKQYREVETTAVGQLFQHDSSDHQWSPYALEKWKLITTIDDYSRLLLHAQFVPEETTWAHIQAAQDVILRHGIGACYYTDSHAIFRFVCHRDSVWKMQRKGTDDVDTEWKQCIEAAGMKVWFAPTPQAKGKIERPYRWLQDRVVRQCAKQNIKTMKGGQMILDEIVRIYNEKWVHSTTKEIPIVRYERAIKEGKSVLKSFVLSPPYESLKDIFCLRDSRVVDGYHRISWRKYVIDVPRDIPIKARIDLHIIPDEKEPEIRLWYQKKVVKVVRLHLS
jgi:transposase InsO family protein